jgi:hypothetical protein
MDLTKNASFNLPQALGALDSVAQRIQNVEEEILVRYGEEFCDTARATKTYQDITKRLSASIGYGIVKDGVIVRTGGFLGGEGEEEGMVTLQRAAFDAPAEGMSLILVAGMHYAIYVERQGYAVLDGARFSAEEILRQIIAQIKT